MAAACTFISTSTFAKIGGTPFISEYATVNACLSAAYIPIATTTYASIYSHDQDTQASYFTYLYASMMSALRVTATTSPGEAQKAIATLDAFTATSAMKTSFSGDERNNPVYMKSTIQELRTFAQAVVAFKKSQGLFEVIPGLAFSDEPEAPLQTAEASWNNAKATNNKQPYQISLHWKEAATSAQQAATFLQQKVEEMTASDSDTAVVTEAMHQQKYWEEKAKLATVKALIAYPPTPNSSMHDPQKIKQYQINEMVKPLYDGCSISISPAMKEFIAHPSKETLAKADPYSSQMSLKDASIAAQRTAAFAANAASTNHIVQHGGHTHYDTTTKDQFRQWAETAQDIATFTKAVADFKAAEEEASN